MMRRCCKCHRTRSVALTIFGRPPLHFCATCARPQMVKYPAPTGRPKLRPTLSAMPLLLKRQREVSQ